MEITSGCSATCSACPQRTGGGGSSRHDHHERMLIAHDLDASAAMCRGLGMQSTAAPAAPQRRSPGREPRPCWRLDFRHVRVRVTVVPALPAAWCLSSPTPTRHQQLPTTPYRAHRAQDTPLPLVPYPWSPTPGPPLTSAIRLSAISSSFSFSCTGKATQTVDAGAPSTIGKPYTERKLANGGRPHPQQPAALCKSRVFVF